MNQSEPILKPNEAQKLSIQEINQEKLYMPFISFSFRGCGRETSNQTRETLE